MFDGILKGISTTHVKNDIEISFGDFAEFLSTILLNYSRVDQCRCVSYLRGLDGHGYF